MTFVSSLRTHGVREPVVQDLRFAPVGAGQTSPGRHAVSASLRSAQNRGPPDVLRPVIRSFRRVLVRGYQGFFPLPEKCGVLGFAEFGKNDRREEEAFWQVDTGKVWRGAFVASLALPSLLRALHRLWNASCSEYEKDT